VIFTTVLFQGAFGFVGLLMIACFVGGAVISRFTRRGPLMQPVPSVAVRWWS